MQNSSDKQPGDSESLSNKPNIPNGPIGWICPRCGRGIAPGISFCPCSGGTATPFPKPYPPDYPFPLYPTIWCNVPLTLSASKT